MFLITLFFIVVKLSFYYEVQFNYDVLFYYLLVFFPILQFSIIMLKNFNYFLKKPIHFICLEFLFILLMPGLIVNFYLLIVIKGKQIFLRFTIEIIIFIVPNFQFFPFLIILILIILIFFTHILKLLFSILKLYHLLLLTNLI